MSRRLPVILLLVLLPLWLAASYGARYGFMEDAQWVGICVDEANRWECLVRSKLGLMIHFGVLGWAALGAAIIGFVVPGRAGWWLAVLAWCCTTPVPENRTPAPAPRATSLPSLARQSR